MATRRRPGRQVRVDLDRLALPGASVIDVRDVPPPSVSDADRSAALEELRECGLPEVTIGKLLGHLESSSPVRIVGCWPTVGEDRKTMEAAVTLANALATVLRDASTMAQSRFLTAAYQAEIGHTPSELRRKLEFFAIGLQAQLRSMPKRSRTASRSDIVAALKAFGGDALGAPTTGPESKFYRACCAAFKLAGISTGPDAAIRAFIRKDGSR